MIDTTIIFLSLFWLLPAGFAGYHAQQLNRNAIKGALVGLVFGWIGVILLVLFLKERDKKTGFLK